MEHALVDYTHMYYNVHVYTALDIRILYISVNFHKEWRIFLRNLLSSMFTNFEKGTIREGDLKS